MLGTNRKVVYLFSACIVLVLSGLAVSSAAPSLSLNWYKNNGYGMGNDLGGEWTINTDVSQDVAWVEFYLDDVLQQNDTVAPFSWNFNTAHFTLGAHTFKVIAYDSAGTSATAVSERNFVEYSFGSVIITVIVVAVVALVILLVTSWFWIQKKAKQKRK
ncbi:MAG: Ig-like domain-containing protein [Candidatus Bathyarchaeota archaeon]|nr:Ig-like domain-containing protein [Candidatus Bathyarchaeota archaeon]